MLSTQDLKTRLQAAAQNDFALPPGTDPFPLATEMIVHIGSTDSELRDDLIYSAFATWIGTPAFFDEAQLRSLLAAAMDEQHLSCGLGEVDTDSVFTRAFSVLLVPLILEVHCQRPFLSAADLGQVKDRLLQFFASEQDLRGYVPIKGWAHAIAHGSDAFAELARCPELGTDDLLQILAAIGAKAGAGRLPYAHNEDERMTTAVISVLERRMLDEAAVEAWIRALGPLFQETPRSPTSFRRLNIKNFLRCVYFRLLAAEMDESWILAARETLIGMVY